jgi:DNA-binding protein H-NS
MFGKKPEPKPDTTFSIPVHLMSFEELIELRQKVDELITPRLHDAISEARQRLSTLTSAAGFDDRPAPSKKGKKKPAKVSKVYANPDNPAETYTKGPFPEWLKAKLDAGHPKEEFLVS